MRGSILEGLLVSNEPRLKPPFPPSCFGEKVATLSSGQDCWEVTGTLREQYYSKIHPKLFERLFAIFGTSSLADWITLPVYMVGHHRADALPTVMICSEDEMSRKKAKKELKKSDFLKQHAKFKMMSVSEDPGMQNLEQLAQHDDNENVSQADMLATEVFIDRSKPPQPLGMQIWVDHGSSLRPATAFASRIEGRIFLRTVSHAFTKTAPPMKSDDGYQKRIIDVDSDSDSDSEPEDEEDDTFDVTITSTGSKSPDMMSDTGSNSDSSLVSLLSSGKSTPRMNEIEEDTAKLVSLDLQEVLSRLLPLTSPRLRFPLKQISQPHKSELESLGELVLSSVDKDWALVEITNRDYLSDLERSLTSDEIEPESLPGVKADVKVFAYTSSGGRLNGTLSGTPFCTRIPNSSSFQEVYRVRLNDALANGDCGSAVRDVVSGELYGHIVAGCKATGVAYIMASHLVDEDFRELTVNTPNQMEVIKHHTDGAILEGSREWLLRKVLYTAWMNDPSSRLLYLSGDPERAEKTFMIYIYECFMHEIRSNTSTQHIPPFTTEHFHRAVSILTASTGHKDLRPRFANHSMGHYNAIMLRPISAKQNLFPSEYGRTLSMETKCPKKRRLNPSLFSRIHQPLLVLLTLSLAVLFQTNIGFTDLGGLHFKSACTLVILSALILSINCWSVKFGMRLNTAMALVKVGILVTLFIWGLTLNAFLRDRSWKSNTKPSPTPTRSAVQLPNAKFGSTHDQDVFQHTKVFAGPIAYIISFLVFVTINFAVLTCLAELTAQVLDTEHKSSARKSKPRPTWYWNEFYKYPLTTLILAGCIFALQYSFTKSSGYLEFMMDTLLWFLLKCQPLTDLERSDQHVLLISSLILGLSFWNLILLAWMGRTIYALLRLRRTVNLSWPLVPTDTSTKCPYIVIQGLIMVYSILGMNLCVIDWLSRCYTALFIISIIATVCRDIGGRGNYSSCLTRRHFSPVVFALPVFLPAIFGMFAKPSNGTGSRLENFFSLLPEWSIFYGQASVFIIWAALLVTFLRFNNEMSAKGVYNKPHAARRKVAMIGLISWLILLSLPAFPYKSFIKDTMANADTPAPPALTAEKELSLPLLTLLQAYLALVLFSVLYWVFLTLRCRANPTSKLSEDLFDLDPSYLLRNFISKDSEAVDAVEQGKAPLSRI